MIKGTSLINYNKIFWPLAYIGLIAFCNWLMVAVPMWEIAGAMIPPVMAVVGFVFIIRDYTQRAWGHWVLAFMAVAVVVSYGTSIPAVATASALAFIVSETIDWAIFTLTKKDLADRILYSSAIAVPIDTAIFLTFMGIFDWIGFWIVTGLKMSSTIIVWLWLKGRKHGNQ